MTILVSTVSIFLSMLFVASLIHKARDVAAFAAAIRAYRLTPDFLANWLTGGFMMAEAAAIVLLLGSSITVAAGLALAALIFSIYSGAIVISLARGVTNFDCGCHWGGGRQSRVRLTWWHAARTILLVVIAFAGFVGTTGFEIHTGPSSMIIGCALAAPLMLVYVGADALIGNWSKLSAKAA